jgi:hypothetical protein
MAAEAAQPKSVTCPALRRVFCRGIPKDGVKSVTDELLLHCVGFCESAA